METSERILELAERLVQTRGYNGFSYADIATSLGVTKASLHYHFPAKAALGKELIGRYERHLLAALAAIDTKVKSPREKLRRYAGIYAEVLRDGRMCLCGMLAADYDTLPDPMRNAVIRFFDDNEAWLTGVLEQGRDDGTVRLSGSANEAAQALVSGLEGALLIARPYGDAARFQSAATQLLTSLVGAPSPKRTSTNRA